jgi:hypothetical protein
MGRAARRPAYSSCAARRLGDKRGPHWRERQTPSRRYDRDRDYYYDHRTVSAAAAVPMSVIMRMVYLLLLTG